MREKDMYAFANELVPTMRNRSVEIQRIVSACRSNPWLADVPESVDVEISFTQGSLSHKISGIITQEQMEHILYEKEAQG